MISARRKKTVCVAMSGGVDSSVAAALLKRQGYRVIGVTMCFNISHADARRPPCCGADGIADAKRAADTLGIDHYVLPFATHLERHVIENFISEYLNGRTPNPCVRCNTYLKFGALFDAARGFGADYLATGHYARLRYNRYAKRYQLVRGVDAAKEQSYFLYGIKKDMLAHVLFPVGGTTKAQVRALARIYGLSNAHKRASQDVCFIPRHGYKEFIEQRVGAGMLTPGPIKDEHGTVVGKHAGLARYTIGQGDKLGISLGRRVYAYRIDTAHNTLHVGGPHTLYARACTAADVNFVSSARPRAPMKVYVKIRYNQQPVPATITCRDGAAVHTVFKTPQRAVTPGQSAVWYRGGVVIGGGIIDQAIA